MKGGGSPPGGVGPASPSRRWRSCGPAGQAGQAGQVGQAGQAGHGGQLADAAALLRALGTPHRLAIVLELAHQHRCVHELVARVGISQSLASQHLRVLRTTGLVTGTRHGKETRYSLADEHVAHIARDAFAHGAEPHHHAPISDPITEEQQP